MSINVRENLSIVPTCVHVKPVVLMVVKIASRRTVSAETRRAALNILNARSGSKSEKTSSFEFFGLIK